ncbi:IclR family transcriptional regulator [Actinocorallia sp. A-T 12471]|uniref:IclR family transcriptional regulator n=1 Tax=Actinocorallia sp. A-T 12471 TaxID=3089813 RepID=UPI0029D19C5B|nr:helix-turn-helix domain-containing protein [Actinocorallia sp. A-T 12471]MDX6741673.1 IclR family transcriptional regulator C-terminal domain-containing protein [Actinocorallia sp. A-T 12471]
MGEAVIDKAFLLLRAFDADHPAQSLASLARRSGLPRSTALRLAHKLRETGALERLEDGRFVVGLGLLEIASLAPRAHGLRAAAMPVMLGLLGATRQHVLLAVRDGRETFLVERLSGPKADPVWHNVGGRTALPTTGVGMVLLAHAPAEVQHEVLAGFRPGQSGDGLRSAVDLRRALAEIRRSGYIVGERSSPWPRSTAAAPIRGADGDVVASISLVTPSAEFVSAHVNAVRTCAKAVSARLDAPGD